jgi:hypothetical protein
MSITQSACGCASTTTIDGSGASPCSCGCCGTEPAAPATKEQRVAELRALRDNIDQELAELDHV